MKSFFDFFMGFSGTSKTHSKFHFNPVSSTRNLESLIELMIVLVFTDGAARGNPGPAGCGVVITDEEGVVIEKHKKFLGETTNNVAEYNALLLGLTEVKKFKKVTGIRCYADSQLIVEQVNGNYKVKNKVLAELHEKIRTLILELPPVQFFHIPREKNKEADKLANQAINEGA